MKRNLIITLIVIQAIAYPLMTAGQDTVAKRLNHYTLAIGVGWTHYFNTLEVYGDQATTNSAGLALRFFWEPEHRLSLGLETGFYRLYKINGESQDPEKSEVTMTATPLLLNVRMRIVDHVYLTAGAGLALMNNKIMHPGEDMTSRITSLSNFQLSASYIRPVKSWLLAGGEVRVMSFGKTSDVIGTVQAVCAIKL